MNHLSECINIWHVTSFGHRLIKEYIWQKPGEWYWPIGPVVSVSYHLFDLYINKLNLQVYNKGRQLHGT